MAEVFSGAEELRLLGSRQELLQGTIQIQADVLAWLLHFSTSTSTAKGRRASIYYSKCFDEALVLLTKIMNIYSYK